MNALVLAGLLSAVAPGAAPPDPAAALAQAQLESARREIAQLRAQVAEQTAKATALPMCEAKNRRLVSIGNELIAAFDRRYRHGRFSPFQLGRKKFETEMQDFGDHVFENRVDATVPRSVPHSDSEDKADTKQKRE